MICKAREISLYFPFTRTTILFLLSVVFLSVYAAEPAMAQKRFSRTYPAVRNVRLQLLNRSGTVVVIGWNRPEISISAYLEAPAANIVPQSNSGTITIDVVRDNPSENGNVGNVNFEIRVPMISNVDIETRMGNLSVTNVGGGLVRACITSEGDITLQNITAGAVDAQNGIGDIFFDGEMREGGYYRFISMKGNISLRIPFNSSFKLMATAPSTRNISLGSFSGPDLSTIGDGRRVVGRFGNGSASLTVTNQRGSISFYRR